MPLKVSDGAGAWIDDFVHSTDPRFKGKSKAKRRQQALAAYYSKKRGESMSSPVLKVLDLIELANNVARNTVSSSPPAGLKQPSVSDQVISSGNATLSNPTSNAPMGHTPNNLNKPTNIASDLGGPEPTPVVSSPQSSLTVSANTLLGANALTQMSPTDASSGATDHMTTKSPREISHAMAKQPAQTHGIS